MSPPDDTQENDAHGAHVPIALKRNAELRAVTKTTCCPFGDHVKHTSVDSNWTPKKGSMEIP